MTDPSPRLRAIQERAYAWLNLWTGTASDYGCSNEPNAVEAAMPLVRELLAELARLTQELETAEEAAEQWDYAKSAMRNFYGHDISVRKLIEIAKQAEAERDEARRERDAFETKTRDE